MTAPPAGTTRRHRAVLADLSVDEMQLLAREVFPPAHTFTIPPWEARFTPGQGAPGTPGSARECAGLKWPHLEA